jgi:hypothetical protein
VNFTYPKIDLGKRAVVTKDEKGLKECIVGIFLISTLFQLDFNRLLGASHFTNWKEVDSTR